MATSDADLIELTRALWPGVTADVASDAYLTAWIPTTVRSVDITVFDEDWSTAIAHLLAHRVYRSLAKAAGGVTSIRTGKLAEGYSDPSAGRSVSDSDLARTVPGQAYLELRDAVGVGLPFGICL